MLSGIFAWALPFFLILLVSVVADAQGGGGAPRELWCVGKNNAEDAALQSALDWTCGPGGADCGPIQNGGPCYDASDLQRTASFAFNNYCTKHGFSDETCNFGNTAALTSLNPSHSNCKFPSSLSTGTANFSGAATDGSDTSDLTSNSSIAHQSGRASIAIHLLFAVLLIF
ncbi:UNVERIFIED_CONTAM: plasmodesmata callose-binding protein 5 [Sesamum calycinum]|uniref:Plasmodesmata callose-binding protein 5 n=2 Tax=Sesamum TaxID=4181 RepID=A0AAW2Q3G2_9LAMI